MAALPQVIGILAFPESARGNIRPTPGIFGCKCAAFSLKCEFPLFGLPIAVSLIEYDAEIDIRPGDQELRCQWQNPVVDVEIRAILFRDRRPGVANSLRVTFDHDVFSLFGKSLVFQLGRSERRFEIHGEIWYFQLNDSTGAHLKSTPIYTCGAGSICPEIGHFGRRCAQVETYNQPRSLPTFGAVKTVSSTVPLNIKAFFFRRNM